MGSVITLTTDFGTEDAYVAAMKGVILSINPEAVIVDICHIIEPQNITQASFVISTAYEYFPPDTIHMVIVDPGVGSQRRVVILRTPTAFFVAPDNGVLSYVIGGSGKDSLSSKECNSDVELRELSAGLQAVSITNQEFWRHPVSSTFHGRDIFASVAAHLSLGVPIEEFGEGIDSLLTFPISHPQTGAKGELIGHIIYIDRFGNLITDIKKENLSSGNFFLEIAGRVIEALSNSYAEADGLLAIIGSSGHLEISLKNGNAAYHLVVGIGDEVMIKRGIKAN